MKKIANVWNNMNYDSALESINVAINRDNVFSGDALQKFSPASAAEEIKEISMKSPYETRELDPFEETHRSSASIDNCYH